MRLLEHPPIAALPARNSLPSYRLRVRSDGRFVDLPPGKSTIGSSPRCHLRVQEAGVQPLHCLILNEAEGLSARRWGGDTFLNGIPFQESKLSPGDCLRIAAVELEVVAAGSSPPAVKPESPTPTAVHDTAAAQQLRAARDQARIRSRKLLAALRKERASRERELDQRIIDLETQLEEAATERRSLAEQHQTTLAELVQVRQQADDHQTLVAARQDLAKLNDRLQRELRDASDREEKLRRELSAAAAARQALLDETTTLGEERKKLLEENIHLRENETQRALEITKLCGERAQLCEQNEKSQADLLELAAEREGLADMRAELSAERDGLRDQVEQLRAEVQAIAAERSSLAGERSVLSDERDELRQQNASLRSELQSLRTETMEIADERAALSRECNGLREQILDLRANVQTLAAEKAAHADEQAVLCGERDGYRHQFERLHEEYDALALEKSALAEERAALCRQRDELEARNESLQMQMSQIEAEKGALAEERTALRDERDHVRSENERLQAAIAQLDEEILALTTAKAAFEEERNWLREENKRFAEVERQMRAAVADRENMSAELYRALLQAAEFQQRVDEYDALAAAHQNLIEQYQEATDQLAPLRQQVDQLNEEKLAAAEAEQAFADETAALREESQRLADENAELIASLTGAREQSEESARDRQESELRLQQANETLQQQLEAVVRKQAEVEARLVHENDTLQRQLEEAQRCAQTLMESAAEWERERVRRQQETSASESILADAERRIADQTQQLTESAAAFRQLELELNGIRKIQASLEQERDDWQRRCSTAAQEQTELLQRVADLEAEIAAMAAAPPARPASDAPLWPTVTNRNETTPVVDDSLEPMSEPRYFANSEREVPAEPADESPFEWGASAVPAGSPDSDTPAWGAGRESFGAPFGGDVTHPQPQDANEESRFQQSAGEQAEAADAWKANWQSKSEPLASSTITDSAAGVPTAAQQTTGTTSSGEFKPASFIERYSHMFAEDNPPQQAPAPSPPPASGAGLSMPPSASASPPLAAQAPSTADSDEESIEQYMSKLLQRVRGQSAGPAEAQVQPTGAVTVTPLVQRPSTPLPATSLAQPAPTVVNKFAWTTAFDGGKPKSAAPAPKTDLEALRALANETARRAISRHALRKHRRNALTKVIVSTLAGVTSLWLMLESPSWRTLQFNTACVALMVAAYWAGQTYRALLQALREKPVDDPEDEVEGAGAGRHLPLPIDVEKPAVRSLASFASQEPHDAESAADLRDDAADASAS
jgi:hypothetical protein